MAADSVEGEEYLKLMAKFGAPFRPERRLGRALAGVGDLRAWIEARVERLGDGDVQVREQATSELASLREALDATLRLAQDTDDPERRERILAILGRVRETPTGSSGKPGGDKR